MTDTENRPNCVVGIGYCMLMVYPNLDNFPAFDKEEKWDSRDRRIRFYHTELLEHDK